MKYLVVIKILNKFMRNDDKFLFDFKKRIEL